MRNKTVNNESYGSIFSDSLRIGIKTVSNKDGSVDIYDDRTGSEETWELTYDDIYAELYECWRQRIKEKKYSREAFNFERDIGGHLDKLAVSILDRSWKPKGYFEFKTHHPERIISAPYYEDRIVEDWHAERFIKPYAEPFIHPNNVACREDKGPPEANARIMEYISRLHEMYGTDFYFLRGDMKGYFDNLSHDRIKEQFADMPALGRILLYNVIDDWVQKDGYAAKADPNHRYGVPKGNLPSQWIGLMYLNDMDWYIAERDDCQGYVRYMDDFIAFFHTKESCKDCKIKIEKYLKDNNMGIRLHPKKTMYAPISKGFTFCGWRYVIHSDGHVTKRIRTERKRLTKDKFDKMSEDYYLGRLSYADVVQKMNGTYAFLKQGNTKQFMRYCSYRYTFTHDKETFKHRKHPPQKRSSNKNKQNIEEVRHEKERQE